jgi:hypothetical protein
MKKTHLAVAAFLLAAGTFAAQAQQPPLIDRAAFFGEVQIAGAQISPDGQYLTFLKPYKGTRNIWVKKVSEPFSAARPLSAEATRPIRIYSGAVIRSTFSMHRMRAAMRTSTSTPSIRASL